MANGKLTVDVAKNKVDSTGGALVSSQALSLASGELVNDGGLIQSQQSIPLKYTRTAFIQSTNFNG
nr:hypothetical protein [Rodentibacter genomosp. 2]